MKQQIAKIMGSQITSDSFDLNFIRVAFFAAAIFVMTLSFWKLSRLELTEAELFFGVLLSLITPLLLAVVGIIFPLAMPSKKG